MSSSPRPPLPSILIAIESILSGLELFGGNFSRGDTEKWADDVWKFIAIALENYHDHSEFEVDSKDICKLTRYEQALEEIGYGFGGGDIKEDVTSLVAYCTSKQLEEEDEKIRPYGLLLTEHTRNHTIAIFVAPSTSTSSFSLVNPHQLETSQRRALTFPTLANLTTFIGRIMFPCSSDEDYTIMEPKVFRLRSDRIDFFTPRNSALFHKELQLLYIGKHIHVLMGEARDIEKSAKAMREELMREKAGLVGVDGHRSRNQTSSSPPPPPQNQMSPTKDFTQFFHAKASQYSSGSVSGCTIIAIEACLQFLCTSTSTSMLPENIYNTLTHPAFVNKILHIGASYISETHLYFDEVLKKYHRYRQRMELLCGLQSMKGVRDILETIEQLVGDKWRHHGGKYPVAVFLTKQPESIALFIFPSLPPKSNPFFFIYDSHPRPNHPTAYLAYFPTYRQMQSYLETELFPPLEVDDISEYEMVLLSTFEANIVRLARGNVLGLGQVDDELFVRELERDALVLEEGNVKREYEVVRKEWEKVEKEVEEGSVKLMRVVKESGELEQKYAMALQ